MTDTVSRAARSAIMRRIKGRDTSPERRVRSALHRAGLRFRLHRTGLPGKPDIVLPAARAVVLVHGCFWHQHRGCYHSGIPLSNRTYWEPKLKRTIARDKKNRVKLARAGWAVHVVWECALARKGTLVALVKALRQERRQMLGSRDRRKPGWRRLVRSS
jgi:DNA mismatch endonuclease (patch repair protein)